MIEVYKIKAKKFYSDASPDMIEANEYSLYIVQGLRTRHKTTEFSIWEDQCGDFSSGESPNDAGLDVCYSLEEVRKILLEKDLISEDAQFINLEEE